MKCLLGSSCINFLFLSCRYPSAVGWAVADWIALWFHYLHGILHSCTPVAGGQLAWTGRVSAGHQVGKGKRRVCGQEVWSFDLGIESSFYSVFSFPKNHLAEFCHDVFAFLLLNWQKVTNSFFSIIMIIPFFILMGVHCLNLLLYYIKKKVPTLWLD